MDSSTLKIEEMLQTPSEILMARDSMEGRSQLTMPRRGGKEDSGETVEEEETDSEEEEEEIDSVEEGRRIRGRPWRRKRQIRRRRRKRSGRWRRKRSIRRRRKGWRRRWWRRKMEQVSTVGRESVFSHLMARFEGLHARGGGGGKWSKYRLLVENLSSR